MDFRNRLHATKWGMEALLCRGCYQTVKNIVLIREPWIDLRTVPEPGSVVRIPGNHEFANWVSNIHTGALVFSGLCKSFHEPRFVFENLL